MIELRGSKVVLRTMEREHCRTLWEQYEVEEPIPTEPVLPGHSLEGSDKWFEEMQEQQGKTQIYLGIFIPGGDLIGDVQLAGINYRNRSARLGAGVARREDRTKGYCTDAAMVMLGFAFEHLYLYRISAATTANNAGALRVLERYG
jgi:RimJ/RimL family protein N-acetyltransferase